jgi:hypothetical protein
MSKAIRTALSLGVSLILCSALMTAQPQSGGNNSDKGDSKEHHSRLGKVAFWRHHKKDDSKAKGQATVKQDSAKTSQVKPASPKQAASTKDPKQQPSPSHAASKPKVQAASQKAPAKTSQVKPASTQQTAVKKDAKQQPSASHAASKPKTQVSSTKGPAKTSQVKPASTKQASAKQASTKQASTKQVDSKKDQKPGQQSASGK